MWMREGQPRRQQAEQDRMVGTKLPFNFYIRVKLPNSTAESRWASLEVPRKEQVGDSSFHHDKKLEPFI